jgi:8-oxo-dGTP diphosphatase
MEIQLALKAIIEKDGKILIIKRSEKERFFKGIWDLPGGKIRFGEEPNESLKREVREETNLEIEIIKPVRVWTAFKNESIQLLGITMLCKYKSGKVKLSKEHIAYEWIEPKEIFNYNTHEGIKKDIKEVFNLK